MTSVRAFEVWANSEEELRLTIAALMEAACPTSVGTLVVETGTALATSAALSVYEEI